MKAFKETFTPETRRYIYTVLLAVYPVLALIGVNLPGDQNTWFVLAAAILGVSQSGFNIINTKPQGSVEDTPVENTENQDNKDIRFQNPLGEQSGFDQAPVHVEDTRTTVEDTVSEVISDGRQ